MAETVPSFSIKEVERILHLDPKDRTTRNITVLSRFFENNRFFKQQSELFEERTILYLLRNLRYCETPAA